MSLFRYPGGKSKLRNQIIAKLNVIAYGNDLEYREPFFGGGGIGLKLMETPKEPRTFSVSKLWINDKDLGISCLWTSVIKHPDMLKSMVAEFNPSQKHFDDFKKILVDTEVSPDTDLGVVKHGFMKLAIHQISYSGLGTKSGGPLGGRKKENISGRGRTDEVPYPIDCRWSPENICKKIDTLHDRFSPLCVRNSSCTSLDFEDVINDRETDAVIYLDPPYYEKGNDLYQHGFFTEDHIRLSETLKKTTHRWVLSYDDCPEIRKLYRWANIKTIKEVGYSITATKDGEKRKSRTKSELFILPRGYKKWIFKN
jgi:DNA adenine methylase